jgi:Mn2+/Fe2+ NRAMP family transporter
MGDHPSQLHISLQRAKDGTPEAATADSEFAANHPVVGPSKPRLLGVLGPGLITGASDDDPSGITAYSQAGAQAGFSLLWLMVFTYALAAVVHEITARIGRTTGRGLAGNIRRYYPRWGGAELYRHAAHR